MTDADCTSKHTVYGEIWSTRIYCNVKLTPKSTLQWISVASFHHQAEFEYKTPEDTASSIFFNFTLSIKLDVNQKLMVCIGTCT